MMKNPKISLSWLIKKNNVKFVQIIEYDFRVKIILSIQYPLFIYIFKISKLIYAIL